MAFSNRMQDIVLYFYFEKGVSAKNLYCMISRAIAEKKKEGSRTWADALPDSKAPSPSTILRWADEATRPSGYKTRTMKREEVKKQIAEFLSMDNEILSIELDSINNKKSEVERVELMAKIKKASYDRKEEIMDLLKEL